MNKYNKIISCSIVFLIIGLNLIPNSIASNTEIKNNGTKGLVQSHIKIEFDPSNIPEVIVPESGFVHIELNISYFISGLFAPFIVPFFRGTMVPIELSVIDVPEWCNASIQPNNIYSPISTKSNDHQNAVLSLSISRYAPAFEVFTIKVQANAEPITGPFGFFTIISGSEENVSIYFNPGFYLAYNIEHNGSVVTPPLETTDIPINITNLGNGQLQARNTIISVPEGFMLTIPPETLIPVNTTEQIILQVQPPEDFIYKLETIQLKFNLSCYLHPEGGFSDYITTIVVHYP